MEIGVGLPGHAPGADARTLVDWARRAEARGLYSVTASDRLVFSTPEPLTMLAAAAAATSRVKLVTTVLLAPLRTNHALFAKSVATVDRIAGPGRLSLGLAPGLRTDDFEESEVGFATRGKRFDALLERIRDVWRQDHPIGPPPATRGGPPLLFGGASDATLRRIVTWGGGWAIGDCTVAEFSDFAARVRKAWADAGRSGAPRLVASLMFALGPNARESVREAIGPYYAFIGDEWVQYSIDSAYVTGEMIRTAIAEFERAGCDELVFTGNDPDPAQVDLLADAIGG